MYSILFAEFSVENINNQVSVSFMHLLNSKKEAIDNKIIELDNIIYQTMMDKNVWMLLKSAEINESHFWPIRNIIDDFINIANTNDVIHSIYFYDAVHSFVISNSKYSKLDFYDKDILEIDKEGNMPNSAFINGVRTINNSKIISYMKKFDVFIGDNVGYFVFNLDYNELFSDVAREQSDIYSEYMIFNGDSPLYFSDYSIIALLDLEDISSILNGEETAIVIDINNIKYFVCGTKSNVTGWTYLYFQDYMGLVRSSELLKKTVFFSTIFKRRPYGKEHYS